MTTDPIPPVRGDNVDERYAALADHLNAIIDGIIEKRLEKVAVACCAHQDAKYQIYLQGWTCLVCHDCKAIVLAYEAKQREKSDPSPMGAVSEAARKADDVEAVPQYAGAEMQQGGVFMQDNEFKNKQGVYPTPMTSEIINLRKVERKMLVAENTIRKLQAENKQMLNRLVQIRQLTD